MYPRVLLLQILALSTLCFSQPLSFTAIPRQPDFHDQDYSSPLQISENELLIFFTDHSNFNCIRSTNKGLSWLPPRTITTTVSFTNLQTGIGSVKLTSGRIVATCRYYARSCIFYSDDTGYSWSNGGLLATGPTASSSTNATYSGLYRTSGDSAIYVYSDAVGKSVNFIASAKGDTSWGVRNTIVPKLTGQNLFESSFSAEYSGSWLCTYRVYDISSNQSKIYYTVSTDNGRTWSAPQIFINTAENITQHKILRKPNGDLYLLYTLAVDSVKIPASSNQYYVNYDILYRKSNDNGTTWSTPFKVTSYKGQDIYFNAGTYSDKILISFASDRGSEAKYYYDNGWKTNTKYFNIYYGFLEQTNDNSAPPLLFSYSVSSDFSLRTPVAIRAHIPDDSLTTVIVKIKTDNRKDLTVALLDDGIHQDSLANDRIYGAVLGGIVIPFELQTNYLNYSFSVTNIRNITIETSRQFAFVNPVNFPEYSLFDINRFIVPIRNDGVLADKNIGGSLYGGNYDSITAIFSAGFYLTGFANGELWGNGALSSSRIGDYLPGPLGDHPSSKKIYELRSSDPPFGESWQIWKTAVDDGAPFYDGDGDGKYIPVDKNRNGIWDANEDHPDLIGDFTAWCVYNDGVPSSLRRWYGAVPMGIEIQQTVFGWADPGAPIDNTFFVRYKITNKSNEFQRYDSVYFSFASDMDLGEYGDDLTGSYIPLDMGYVYNEGDDAMYGHTPPAIAIQVLQGPVVYIPGETFLDNNGNGIFDNGTDTPLDTAYQLRGKHISSSVFPGAKNLGMTAFTHYMASHPRLGDPNLLWEIRNYQLGGKDKTGQELNPCTWPFGIVKPPVVCSQVDPLFMYSGDPANDSGWINTAAVDQRVTLSSGPFVLERNKPIELIAAYVAGRDTSPLTSVNTMKSNAYEIKRFYESDFSLQSFPGENLKASSGDFALLGNYPNPFNPSTLISFRIGENNANMGLYLVTLKIFDILGREIAILASEDKSPGIYNVNFSAAGLASGVYFYRLEIRDTETNRRIFNRSQKMLYLK